ncbi:MAG: diguanylate cyclase [Cyanobacteria bacterium]|nr:diguanylate cyclase [Cyanobacteriota bacterium]
MANLLIVDDDATIRTFLSLAMRRDGHRILMAVSGEECLNLVQQEPPDLILLDAKMPGMDGFTCCAQLKTRLRDQCPPVIMITGLSDTASVDRAFAVGAINYATKPIHLAVLRHRVQQVIREQELMKQMASINQQLATANKELNQMARIDSLTQIANRRAFDEVLLKEWQHSARYKRPLGILVCDVDYFKQYNDIYGHQAGDLCLKHISQSLQLGTLRMADLVARYGGEEFVVLLPETNGLGTLEVATRLHTKVSNAAIPHAGSQLSSVITVSIGASWTIPSLYDHPKNFFETADQALYEAGTGLLTGDELKPLCRQ